MEREPPSPTIEEKATRPSTIGGFQIEHELGAGGMGVVYRATDATGAAVALKVLNASLLDPEIRLRFQREAAIRVDHPNVVRVLDAGIEATTSVPYIALELLEGETLEQRLRAGRLAAPELIDLGIQAAAGLEAAHAAGFIHRDLKPSNLFRCSDGTLKIVDFGIALASSATRLTSTHFVIGTAAYMSPEQVRGDRALDGRTDVWSLGVVLYELASGERPFQRDTTLATMLAVRMEEAAPLAARVSGLPAELYLAIERCLAKPRQLRFANVGELRHALSAISCAETSPPTSRLPAPSLSGTPAPATEVIAAPAMSPIAVDERRIVAVLLATGVRDRSSLAAAVGERGGTLIPLFDQRALGLFGADRWEGDEVGRAADAALTARGAADRVAVASGRATSSAAGISGDLLAAAEEGCAAELDGVALDPATARALGPDFSLVETRPGLFEITGRHEGARHDRRPAHQSLMLGRSDELAQMSDALRRVVENQRAIVVLISGPPGIGKSRLRQAFDLQIAQDPEVRRLATRCEPLRRERALSAWAGVLGSHLARLAEMPVDEAHPMADSRRLLLRLAREATVEEASAQRCAEFLGELLGISLPPGADVLAARADPQLMVDRLRITLLDYFEGLTRRGPVALVLEDLQWADAASLDLLADLVDQLAETPLLVVATARPELVAARDDLFAGRHLVRIQPRGLIASDVAALAEHVAGRPLPGDLRRAIAERSGGNPLFVEQIVLELADRGLLDDQGIELPIPLTVEAAVQSRLDQLPPAGKDACKRAAIFARGFTSDELEGLGVTRSSEVLSGLVGHELLAARGRPGRRAREYRFKSPIVRDVAYGMIADGARRDLHQRAASYLGQRKRADDEEVAGHHERGGQAAAASRRYAAAAVAASLLGDAATVLRCSERALQLEVPSDLEFAVCMARADALRFVGNRGEQAVYLARARELATCDRDLARVVTEQVMVLSRTGRPLEALAAAEEAVAAAERAHDPDVLAVARGWRVGALIYGGRLEEARDAFLVAGAGAENFSLRTRAALTGWRAHIAMALGNHGERQLAFTEAAHLHREAGDLRRAAASEANLADVYNRVGAYAEAEASLRHAREGCRRVGNRAMEGYAVVNLGFALAMQGRAAEGLESLREASDIAAATHESRLGLWAKYYRLRFGERENAQPGDTARSVAREAEQVGEVALCILARTTAAGALLEAGAIERADQESESAFAELVLREGIEEGEADVYLTRARVLDALGRSREAHDVRQRGRERVLTVGAKIVDVGIQKRFFEEVAANRELIAAGRY